MILSTFPSTLLYLAKGDFERALDCVREYGLDAVDLTPAQTAGRTAKEMKALMDKKGVRVGGSHCVLPIASPDPQIHAQAVKDAEAFLHTLAVLGSTRCMVVPGALDVCVDLEQKPLYREQILRGLPALVKTGRELGIRVNIENFSQPKTPFSTIEECSFLLDRVEGLSFCFDMGNFIYMDIDPLSAYDALGSRTVSLHLKDVRSQVEKDGETGSISPSGRYLYPCDLGEGQIPVRELLRRFKRDGFDGPVTLELFSLKGSYEQFDRTFRENIQTVRKWIES